MKDNKVFIFVAFVWITIAIAAMTTYNQDSTNLGTDSNDAATADDIAEVRYMLNEYRQKKGVPTLQRSEVLQKAAERQSQLIAEHEVLAAVPAVRIEQGYPTDAQANLIMAWGTADPSLVLEQLILPPIHESVIIDTRWKSVGITVTKDDDLGIFWVFEFGDITDSEEPVE